MTAARGTPTSMLIFEDDDVDVEEVDVGGVVTAGSDEDVEGVEDACSWFVAVVIKLELGDGDASEDNNCTNEGEDYGGEGEDAAGEERTVEGNEEGKEKDSNDETVVSLVRYTCELDKSDVGAGS
ncbi:hypothetical protein MMC25_000879 [Agyrium rufum]|nr:hypothetical protein [Agyrium rufum]